MTSHLTLSYWVYQSLSKIIDTFLLFSFGNVLNMFPVIQIMIIAPRNQDSVPVSPPVNPSGQPPGVTAKWALLVQTAMSAQQVTMETRAVSTFLSF